MNEDYSLLSWLQFFLGFSHFKKTTDPEVLWAPERE